MPNSANSTKRVHNKSSLLAGQLSAEFAIEISHTVEWPRRLMEDVVWLVGYLVSKLGRKVCFHHCDWILTLDIHLFNRNQHDFVSSVSILSV